jgi:hypothetical protein
MTNLTLTSWDAPVQHDAERPDVRDMAFNAAVRAAAQRATCIAAELTALLPAKDTSHDP